MHDMAARLEKLRKDAAECALIRDLATDPAKRELFTNLAEQYKVLADAVELTMSRFGSGSNSFLGRRIQEPFPQGESTYGDPAAIIRKVNETTDKGAKSPSVELASGWRSSCVTYTVTDFIFVSC